MTSLNEIWYMILSTLHKYLNPVIFNLYSQEINGYQIVAVFGIALFLVIPYVFLTQQKEVKQNAAQEIKTKSTSKPRFRKRDKIKFYANRMVRKVKELKENVLPGAEDGMSIGKRRFKRKKSSTFNITEYANRLLRSESHDTERKIKRPPAALLEADQNETSSNENLPTEIMYMLKSVRVFGHFDDPLFFGIYKNVISKKYPAGKVIFKPGEMNECIYIVQAGQLNLYLVDKKGTEMLLKKVKAGENIHSVMNILDALRGGPSYKYSILIRAATESIVLLLPSRAFKQVFEDHPESLVRVVQMVMLRLQQVTFQAFHKFLGLSTELVSSQSSQRVNENLKSLSVYTLTDPDPPVMEEPLARPRTRSLEKRIPSIQEDPETTPPHSPRKSPYIKRRSASVDLYGIPSESVNSFTGSTDFNAVLGRVGLEGTSDEEHSAREHYEFPQHQHGLPELATDTTEVNYGGLASDEEEKMLAAARSDLVKLLCLPTPKLLDDILAIDVVPADSFLFNEGEKDCGLVFLVKGKLEVSQTKSGKKEVLFTNVPGEFIGALSLLTGDPSFFTVTTKETSYVVNISKINFYKLIKEHPRIVLPVANSLVQKMSSLVRNIDFALDWILQESGKQLFRQNEQSDSIYILLNGRLRAVRTHASGTKEIVYEYGRGELVGLVEVLTNAPRAKSVHAVRDTELAQIPEGLLNTIKIYYPQVVSRLIQLLGARIIGNTIKGSRLDITGSSLERVAKNLGTIAVIPGSNSVPIHNFTFELGLAVSDIGDTLVLTSDVIKRRLGNAVLENIHEYNLTNWLGHQEDLHRIVVYQADMSMTAWTKRCIRQADAILIVGRADEDPQVGKLEAQLEGMTFVRAQKDLILLHEEETFERPSNTVEWLNARDWISAHHHVRCPRKIFRRRLLADRYAQDPENYVLPSKHSDFARLARVLTGTSVGLVLGGGGARGISHIGIIKVLREHDIPIDSVGGTSMGAYVGALYATHGCVVKTTQRCREGCVKLASLWRKVLDLTYPFTSLFTGKAFNKEIESTFGDLQIEDMLLPFFCITTDISDSKMKIHQTGSCWRYVRASMSLSGYLPPMCDPVDGHHLLDGGYVNNLPGDVMRSLGVKKIICVDVGSKDDVPFTNFGDSLSGWWMLWKKLNPFASPVRIPDMNGIQSRLAYVSCVGKLEEIKDSDLYTYLRPPINSFKTLEFGSFNEILETGYRYGTEVMIEFAKSNAFSIGQSPDLNAKSKQITVQNHTAPSFPDLAELVSRIKPVPSLPNRLFDYYSDDDDFDDVHDYERGVMSDNEIVQASYLSATEEMGYESEDTSLMQRRRILKHDT